MPSITIQADPPLNWHHLRRLVEEATDALGGESRCSVQGNAEEGWVIESSEPPPPPQMTLSLPPAPMLMIDTLGGMGRDRHGVLLLGEPAAVKAIASTHQIGDWVRLYGREEKEPRISDLPKPVQRVVDLLLKLEECQQEAVLGFCESAFSILGEDRP